MLLTYVCLFNFNSIPVILCGIIEAEINSLYQLLWEVESVLSEAGLGLDVGIVSSDSSP